MFQLGCFRDEYFVQKWSLLSAAASADSTAGHMRFVAAFPISFGNGTSFRAASSSKLRKYSSGKSFWVRLLDPVAILQFQAGHIYPRGSHSISRLRRRTSISRGPGSRWTGVAARKVGLGFVHETASLEIIFDRIVTADGSVLPSPRRLWRWTMRVKPYAKEKSAASWPRHAQGRITDGLGIAVV